MAWPGIDEVYECRIPPAKWKSLEGTNGRQGLTLLLRRMLEKASCLKNGPCVGETIDVCGDFEAAAKVAESVEARRWRKCAAIRTCCARARTRKG